MKCALDTPTKIWKCCSLAGASWLACRLHIETNFGYGLIYPCKLINAFASLHNSCVVTG